MIKGIWFAEIERVGDAEGLGQIDFTSLYLSA